MLGQRTENTVRQATEAARQWRLMSEIMMGATALLFLCVLYFILKQRILRPVVRLSDVVTRLAAQDYAVEIGRASCRERVVSVRVDLGGRRIIKKKNIRNHDRHSEEV